MTTQRSTTQYSHDIRILTCQACGAPIDAPPQGGQVKCAYCGATHTVTQRDERTDLERARLGLGAAISESERHTQLRLQQSSEQELPQNLRAWLQPDGALNPAFAQHAQHDWQVARQQLAAGSNAFTVAERLFYLTLLLAPQLEERRRRALLETAAELLADERHRHVVRCMLARHAAQHSDIQGAQAWLQTCNPRPTDLTMDTAYRYAAATLAVVQQDSGRVAELLGTQSGDVPLATRDAFACELLRTHCIEQVDLERACGELDRLAATRGELALQGQRMDHAPLVLCPQSYPERQRRKALRMDQAMLAAAVENRRQVRVGLTALIVPLVNMPFIAAALLLLLVPIRCMSDSDPLLGVYGMPLCPQVCATCYGPSRTVTRWSQSGGEFSSDGAEYYCNSATARIDRLNDARLEEAAGTLGKQQLGFVAAAGGSYLTLLALLALTLPINGYRRHRAGVAEALELDQQIRTLSQRMGQELPEVIPAANTHTLLSELRYLVISVVVASFAILISLAT